MAEYKNPQEGFLKEGYFPNTSHAVLELHRLLSLFLASRSFAALRNNFPGEGFDPIYEIQSVEEDEVTRLLLNLAITARVIDDGQDRVFGRVGSDCGQLVKNYGGDEQTEALGLREACNKIIHAKKIRFDVEEVDGQPYFKPYIYFYGDQSGKAWKAILDVVAFSKDYYALVCYI